MLGTIEIPQIHPLPPLKLVFGGNEPKNHPKNLLKAKNCQACGMNESGQCG
jgi:hypothetical protein